MAAASSARRLLVDVHTHIYLPRYADLLRSRTVVPRILPRNPTSASENADERLVIFEDEPPSGRPVGPQYWDRTEKLKFMDKHGIDISIVSSANPWLDFLPPASALSFAHQLNADLDAYCASSPALPNTRLQRLYGLALLPLTPGSSPSDILNTIADISTNRPHLRGVILGTRALGTAAGLADPALEPVWEALAAARLVVFLHPHYGVSDTKATDQNGHVMPLALGFPFETTIATTRLILAGVLDRHPTLRLLLAHSGGALAQLSSRLASCIAHDPIASSHLQHDARYYIGRLYFDAVAYGAEELGFVSDVVSRADAYVDPGASAANSKGKVDRARGSRRMVFGTDHPFFPPLGAEEKWRSVVENLEAIDGVDGWSESDKDGVRGGNAIELFSLET